MKKSWLASLLLASACASRTPLTLAGQQVRVLERPKATAEAISAATAPCKFVGALKSDDRNEVLNAAAARGADTVVLRKGETYSPDWDGTFYLCGQPKP